MSKRRGNAAGRKDGEQAYENFCKSQRVQAELLIANTTPQLGKMRQWGALHWSSEYTQAWLLGYESAMKKARSETDSKAGQ